MKRLLQKKKIIAFLLCVTMFGIIIPISPFVAFGSISTTGAAVEYNVYGSIDTLFQDKTTGSALTMENTTGSALKMTEEQRAFYDKLLATQTYEEYLELYGSLTEEESAALEASMNDEEKTALEKHILLLRCSCPEIDGVDRAGEEYEHLISCSLYKAPDFDIPYSWISRFSGVEAGSLFDFSSLMPVFRFFGLTRESEPEIETTKKATDTLKDAADGKDIYQITLGAEATSNVSITADPVDIILVLDTSEQMYKQKTVYTKQTFANKAAAVTKFNELAAIKADTETLFYLNGEGKYQRVSAMTADSMSLIGGGEVLTDWHNRLYTRERVRDDSGINYLADLQEAAKLFVDKAYSPNGERRIAIVNYNDTSSIVSSNDNNSDTVANNPDDALVPVNANGKNALHNIIDSLSLVENADANVNLALNDARKIFQGGHNDDTSKAGDAPVPEDRPRMVVLLSAGVYGNGKLETLNNYSIAMQATNISAILKSPRNLNAQSQNAVGNFNYGIDTDSYFVSSTNKVSEPTEKAKYTALGLDFDGAPNNSAFQGCGSTIYVVGIGMPKTESWWADNDDKFAGLYEWKTANWESEGARINELFYRVSSHRPDGTHPPFLKKDGTGNNAYYSWDIGVPITYVKKDMTTGEFVNLYATTDEMLTAHKSQADPTKPDYWSAQYLDQLCRNIDNGDPFFGARDGKLEAAGSYFLTTDDADDLASIFQNIADQLGATNQVRVVDYISQYFVPCDENGNALEVGASINGGTLCKDDNGWYVQWDEVVLDPGIPDSTGQIQEGTGKAFNETIYVKARQGFLGGVGVPTNADGSRVVIVDSEGNPVEGKEDYSFPTPTVEVAHPCIVLEGNDMVIYYKQEIQKYEFLKSVVNDGIDLQYNTETGAVTLEDWMDDYTSLQLVFPDDSTISNEACKDDGYRIVAHLIPNGAENDSTKWVEAAHVDVPVHILTPEVTWKDINCYYGDVIPSQFMADKVEWKCAHAAETTATAPAITYGFSIENVVNGRMPNVDIPVIVNDALVSYVEGSQISIKNVVTHIWEKDGNVCKESCDAAPENAQFRIHPLTCSLTIQKDGWNSIDENQTFIFNVKGGVFDNVDVNVTVHGNGNRKVTGLPIGSYSVTEYENWSWRYDALPGTITLSANENCHNQTITIENTRRKDKWLSGDYWVENWFGRLTATRPTNL